MTGYASAEFGLSRGGNLSEGARAPVMPMLS
jgi:hypothetical protein